MEKKGKSDRIILKLPMTGTGISILLVLIAIAFTSLVVTPVMAQQAKVTAATTAASEVYEAGPLDVFGNANEDDTIDMRDTTYIKLVIFGKKPKTKLADANYDGKVSMLDVGQTKLIILGKEKKLTFIDIFGEAETVNKPIKRLAHLGCRGIIVTRSLNAMDILLPVAGGMTKGEKNFFPVISEWPEVRYGAETDFEYVLNLNPDAVAPNIEGKQFLVGGKGKTVKNLYKEKLPGIPLICLNMREQDVLPQNVRTLGYILDRKNEAEEFIDWFEGSLNIIKARTEELSEDEKPRFLMTWMGAIIEPGSFNMHCSGNRYAMVMTIAGGRNIADEIVGPDHPSYGGFFEVDPEWVIEQNPEYIFIGDMPDYIGYETDDPSKVTARRQEFLDNHPEFANVNAVKNGRVYILPEKLLGGAGYVIPGTAYGAKLLHPDLFEDFDPQVIHQEYVDKFCRIDFDVRERGVFIYPTPEWLR